MATFFYRKKDLDNEKYASIKNWNFHVIYFGFVILNPIL